ncbi:hypothetical protein [Luteolibacter sp. LG18]|uniref:hypothetical protein n=1 Tax=Luteolibacter sp. LG18 TaxID=2819286 RepID=UPI002B2C0C4E|nr:hypothetical protein llg_18950 [Luteolibacter sp. LG18]
MELSGNWKRWLALVVIVGAFAAFKGFVPPHPVHRGWIHALLAFMGGAVSATVIDHWVGNLDRSNLRWAYVVFGVLLMAFGSLCLHASKGGGVQ